MIAGVIVACEIGFWVLVGLGLATRYVLRRRRAGLVLLALTPLVDVVLLVATALDLRAGATANPFHGLAALYLGFSVAYGHKLIQWADVRFAHRFAGGPAPVRLHGGAYTRECWHNVRRTATGVLVAAAALWFLTVLVGDPERTSDLEARYPLLAIIFVVDLIWATSYTVWPRKPRRLAETG
ncbi:hypothetical protein I6A84_31025 [Frankia sp. CNm7]|uniref:Uncharacterized protein n=1 Tax=Frankia nepalensis TaxID=1836974 RepID=A0A937URP7_9ACTN|nr:hypothetical protein [Frankia nepalensis]MBL7498872.1 hypothetical protein [Frankia nepalensis]MBL7513704.1 hypothetical protein [Frankia nepalensis]MBL7522398.1 hypothetical protein [Frankia nepalensis]MBL7631348.1 hypothetical protein [Frankia nepalensis]